MRISSLRQILHLCIRAMAIAGPGRTEIREPISDLVCCLAVETSFACLLVLSSELCLQGSQKDVHVGTEQGRRKKGDAQNLRGCDGDGDGHFNRREEKRRD